MEGSIALCRSLAMVVMVILPALSAASAMNLQALIAGWLLTRGRRTITNMIRAAGLGHLKNYSTFYRLLSKAMWSVEEVQRLWAVFLVKRFYPRGVIPLVGDDSLLKHRGPKLYGAGIYRDAVRSGRRHSVFHWGHNWVVLALPVSFPLWPHRFFSLPIACRLRIKGQPQTAVDLMVELLKMLCLWFPQRKFEFCGDGGFSSVVEREPEETTVISRIRCDAEVFEIPSPSRPHQMGRRRVRGPKIPGGPRQIAQDPGSRWKRTRLWMYGQPRQIQYCSRVVIWTRTRRKPVRVVIVSDAKQRNGYDYLLCTNPQLHPRTIIQHYARRYTIERTFEDTKQFLGLEQPQVRTPASVLRAAPLGLLLYGMIVYWYAQTHRQARSTVPDPWYRTKPHESFQDMLSDARVATWRESSFFASDHPVDTNKILGPLWAVLSGVG